MASSTGAQAPISGSNLRHVSMVSGQPLQVQGDDEVAWFEATRDKYLDETKFSDATDLRDLDRLLILELMVYRWTVHLASGVDYEGDIADEEQLRKNIKDYSSQIDSIKKAMGLNKAARDAEANEGNVADYIQNLKARAKAFGIHRERQLRKALELMNELHAIVGAFDRSDQEEREKIGFESEAEILEWVRNTMLPEYTAIDEHFRQNEQKFWVRSL